MSRKFALIIGTSECEDIWLSKSKAVENDVTDFAQVLSDSEIGDFEVITILNQPESATRRAIAQFFTKRKPDDLLLLYYSGPGIKDDDGRLYFGMQDTEMDLVSASALSSTFVAEEMQRSRSRAQVLILDCMYSGAFAKSIASPVPGVVLSASNSVQYTWDREGITITNLEGNNSLFTSYLIEGLRTGEADANSDGYIDVHELFNYAYRQITSDNESRQTPTMWAYRQKEEIIIARNPMPVWLEASLLRLQHLVDNVKQDLILLKEYENAWRYTDEPRQRAKYRREIEELRRVVVTHQQEYSEMLEQEIGKPPAEAQEIAYHLQHMQARLSRLVEG